MSWLRILHETTYRYKEAVRFGAHRLVLRPREGHDLRVDEMRLEITPEFELEWSRDVFGNSVATVTFLSAGNLLKIRSQVLVHQTAPFPQHPRKHSTPVPFPVEFSETESVVAEAYRKSTYPGDTGSVRDWVEANVNTAAIGNAQEAVIAVGAAVRNNIKYQRREAKGVQSPGETVKLSSGSCRDMATLMLEALRNLGLPARFASGYLDCLASEAGRASTHAWAEAYLPEIGWIGYDPTIGELTSGKHVVTGVSNHPRGVMPVSGSYFHKPDVFLGMTVSVRTKRLKRKPRS